MNPHVPAEEEMLADMRRGRLVKKLGRALQQRLAGTLRHFTLHTWVLVCAMLLVHIVCYVVITTLIAARN